MQQLKSRGIQDATALLLIIGLLTGLGLLIIYTSSSIPAYQRYGDAFHFVRKQAFISMFGFFLIFLIAKVPFRLIEMVTLPAMALTIFLLALTLVPGIQSKANGAARWLNLGVFTFQPAELAKLSLILFLSRNLSRSRNNIHNFWSGVFPNLLVVSFFGTFLMLQPDFGSTFLLFVMTLLMLFVAGIGRKYIATGVLLVLATVICAVAVAPYRLARLTSFLDPWEHVQKGGFQIIQSYLGFQNGGLWGLGLGQSLQKLYFLPEAHTDFILAVIGEELGLFGVVFVICTFACLTILGFRITRQQALPARKFLAFGLTALIAIQAAINMGVAMGLLPTKGIPLPFVSSGSSSLLIFLICGGLLFRLGKESESNAQPSTPP